MDTSAKALVLVSAMAGALIVGGLAQPVVENLLRKPPAVEATDYPLVPVYELRKEKRELRKAKRVRART